MLVYGDHERVEEAGAVVAAIGDALHAYRRSAGGLAGHARLVAAFIRLGELAQGLADAERQAAGADIDTPQQRLCAELLLWLARCIGQSWESRFEPVMLAERTAEFAVLAKAGAVVTRQAEGYAHYALYPESYFLAARRSGVRPDTRVIGIRSIGIGLGAMVAAGLGAGPALSLRPFGHPFARALNLSPQLRVAILDGAGAFAIVDEGPGKSGSSFGCVADWLAAQGVPRGRVHYFPGHGGEPGEAASPERRQSWRGATRHFVGFEDLGMRQLLSRYMASLVGPLDRPLQDISGGAWRDLGPEPHPPADRQMEKRKYLAVAREQRWLLKFAGLGEYGMAKLEHGRRLGAQGLMPMPLGLVHGFLVQSWIDGRRLAPDESLPAGLPEQVGRYIGTRARLLPARTRGASVSLLAEMAAVNIAERLGEQYGEMVRARLAAAPALDELVQPVHIDGRLHAWEWVASADGRLIKTDGLDHASGHDLVGCQDVCWDIVGAIVEFQLSGDEAARLVAITADAMDRTPDERLLAAMELCYLGFQVGLWTDAAGRADDAERTRIERLLERYANHATRLLSSAVPA